jgi:hypothetical protein
LFTLPEIRTEAMDYGTQLNRTEIIKLLRININNAKDIDACGFKNFDFYLSHCIHAFCLFTSIYNVLLNYASATAVF